MKGCSVRALFVALFAAPVIALASPFTAKANSILVGQCVEFETCWFGPGPTPWSDNLSLADLVSLGLGTTQPFVAAQTSEITINLGVTTITFDLLGGGTDTQNLGEFTGGFELDPCNYCEIDIVGSFFIPVDALDATISGTFGNSFSDVSAGVDLWLGPVPGSPGPSPVPGPIAGAGLPGFILDAAGDNPQLVGKFIFDGTLPPGQSVTRTAVVTIPTALSGNEWFVVQADATNETNPDPRFDNHQTVATAATIVSPPPSPNLVISSITPPTAAVSGQQTQISWTITNTGSAGHPRFPGTITSIFHSIRRLT